MCTDLLYFTKNIFLLFLVLICINLQQSLALKLGLSDAADAPCQGLSTAWFATLVCALWKLRSCLTSLPKIQC